MKQIHRLKKDSTFNSGRIDVTLLICILSLTAIGLLFVYSASYYTSLNQTGSKYHYFFKQLIGAVAGVVLMFIVMRINLSFLRKLALPLLILSLILLALVFVPFIGVEKYGAKRWIGFGSMTFQPSEIAKFSLVLFCAYYVTRENTDMKKFLHILPIVGAGGAMCVLIILEPNMSITVCVGLLMLILIFLSGVKIKHFLLLLTPALLAVPALIFAEPYRIKRLLAFIDPWATPKDEGYQLIQSLYALGSGGWFGVGIFNSRQKYSFLPFAESDFVFSVIGEETGLIGCLIVLILYATVIFRGVRTAINATNRFDALLAGGITAVIGVQTLINFCVVTGLIPPTGLPLPFISFGGTSLLVFLVASGILLNISKNKVTPKNSIIKKRIE